MNRFRMFGPYIGQVIHGALFFCYYYLISTLCWIMVAPNQLVAIHPYEHNVGMAWMLSLSLLCGALLSLHGVATSSINAKEFYIKGDVVHAIKSYVDLVFCLSLIMLPAFVLANNVAISAHCSSVLLITMTCLFLAMTTAHYQRARRARKTLKEMSRA